MFTIGHLRELLNNEHLRDSDTVTCFRDKMLIGRHLRIVCEVDLERSRATLAMWEEVIGREHECRDGGEVVSRSLGRGVYSAGDGFEAAGCEEDRGQDSGRTSSQGRTTTKEEGGPQ